MRSIVFVALCATISGAGWLVPLTAAAQETETVFIERKPLVLRSPEQFQTPIALRPMVEVTLTSSSDGPVQTVLCKLGETVSSQVELVRTDSEEQRLLVERAKAALTAAREDGSEAKTKVAEVDLQLAQLRLERAKTLAPFEGRVIAVHTVAGEFVRVGSPLVTLIDSSKLIAHIPVERATTKEGDKVPVTIEGKPYDADVKTVLPLTEEFEPLRDLFESVATAVVEFDNISGDLAAGQTVRSDMIPRDPVAEVPNTSVSASEDGVRKVMVIRDDIATDVAVQVLGAADTDDTFVAGEFAEGDELVTVGFDQLVAGRRVVPVSSPIAAASDSSAGRPNRPAEPKRYIPREPEDDGPARNVGGF